MANYVVKVIAYELVTVEADSEDQACEKAGERFGNNIEISETEIVESSKN
ncbi:hypothetical protein [Acinetobacter lactucae]|nr:hypothetical protein [Acinetobacter lactucae]